MFGFLGVTSWIGEKENDTQQYKDAIVRFEMNVKEFYVAGRTSFLQKEVGTQNAKEVYHKTFYMHALCFYLLQIAKDTLQEHKLGVGIFTMQGFEQRNKESKMKLQRYSNFRGEMIRSNLEKVWQLYYHEM